MPNQYKVMAFAAAAMLMAAPAVADGYANRPVNHGPAPLQAHAELTPPEPGCYLVGPDTWSCPPLPKTAQRSHAATSYTSSAVSHGYSATHAGHGHAHGATCGYNSYESRPAQVSYVSRPAPQPVRRAATLTATRTSYARSDVTIDIAGFDGGVGNGVDGGYYGGGGGFAYASASSSASAFSSATAALTFQGGFRGGGGKKHHGGGGCNKCGGGGGHKGGGHGGGGH